MQPYLQATHLTCRYGKTTGIDGIDVQINKGEVLALLGSNGAGKSTTLRILAGLQKPASGSVMIDGIELLQNPKRLQHSIGYVPDTPTLCKGLNVEEFLLYCAQLRGAKTNALQQVDAMIELCDLDSVKKRLVQHLSLGLRQRVGLAQALIHKPAVLLLDEPTTGLDPAQVIQFRSIIDQFRPSTAILLSTHQLSEVELLADRVQILSHGQCIFEDSLANIHTQDSIRLRFAPSFTLPLLDSIESIDSIDSISESELMVRSSNTEQTLHTLMQMAIAKNWPLLELYRREASLESLYIEKTRVE